MATTISYQDIEKRLSVFKESFSPEEIPYIILKSFGATDTYIKRYKEGKGVISTFNGLMIKGLLAYRQTSTEELISELEAMKSDPVVQRAKPRLLITSDGTSIQAYDPKEDETYDNKLKSLWLDFQFFYPLAGVERYRGIEENPADVKAAEKMAKLHDEIRRYNEFSSDADLHDLNIFMTRLLFCYFAEDTGIFEENLFTASISRYTQEDGSDLSDYLSACFNIMDKDLRVNVPSIISQFPYVNGGLFHKQIAIPKMGYRARKLILECGGLNWKDINPDIFGSMIQAVVSPGQRGSLGMHYTSVPNIMKVIQPLFLDDLYEEFTKVKDNIKGLRQLLIRISKMKFFDPACGSGNFLIIAYKELRKLEILIWKQISTINKGQYEIPFVNIQLNQFYGIEIDDFAHEVAMLSLWLAEHQMNCMFTREFANVQIPSLPLRTNGNIIQGNACRVDWNEVCPHTEKDEVFVMGNPPYVGRSYRDNEQQIDMDFVFLNRISKYKDLDYISCWFYKAIIYGSKGEVHITFVSTNSICQGIQVSLLWPHIFNFGFSIFFAHTAFRWENNAKNNATVTCVIIGISSHKSKTVFTTENKQLVVSNISPYLIPSSSLIIEPTKKIISKLPPIVLGSAPKDNGGLIFSKNEYDNFIAKYPNSKRFIKKFIGADEFINGEYRYCLYIKDSEVIEASQNDELLTRLLICKKMRSESKKEATRKLAKYPNRFGEDRYQEKNGFIIPAVSSEKRLYLPIGYVESNTIVSNSSFVLYSDELFPLGVIMSQIHLIWIRTVCGALETRIRYAPTLGYNTFPFPKISDEKKKEIEAAAEEVLLCREDYPDKTLAELYDPDKMPDNLRQAHHALDLLVESCYQDTPFESDEERLECLFKLYEKMTKKENKL